MSFPEVLRRITGALEAAGVAHMLTGSFASVYYGSPRSTQDIDLVITGTPVQLRTFIEYLPRNEYYADLDAALEAQTCESMFNVIDLKTGWKIDLIIRKARPYSLQEFDRRQRVDLQGVSLFVASAEDVVLSKLEWAKLAHSPRQIDDAAGILRIQGDSLDRAYLDKWVGELNLEQEWNVARLLARTSARS